MPSKKTKTEPKRLYRPNKGRKIAGVAAGMAEYFNVDVVLVRLVWLFLLIPGGFPGLIPYLVAWAVMPSEDQLASK